MARKKAAGRKKKVSLSEFRAWLEGVEELQPDDWAPSKDQWVLIRSKIDSIVADEVVVKETPPRVPQNPVPHSNLVPQQVRPVVVDGQPINVPMVGDTTPPVVPADNPLLNPTGGAGGTPGMTSTPNIDTKNGNYQSSFT